MAKQFRASIKEALRLKRLTGEDLDLRCARAADVIAEAIAGPRWEDDYQARGEAVIIADRLFDPGVVDPLVQRAEILAWRRQT